MGHFYSICVAAVARQLDSRNLHEALGSGKNDSGLGTMERMRSEMHHAGGRMVLKRQLPIDLVCPVWT